MPRAVVLIAFALSSAGARASPKFIVVIDPGHGGARLGARGPGRLWEKAVALSVSRKLGAIVEKEPGTRVLFTRKSDEDVELADRVDKANQAGADLFVSVHANSMATEHDRRTVQGAMTFFLSADATDADAAQVAALENEEGGAETESPQDAVGEILDDLARTVAHADASRLAYAVQRRLVADLSTPDRGVKQAPFRVLMGAKMPAVLVEIGFISHPSEGKRLGDPAYQEKVARAIATAIAEFRREVLRRDLKAAAAGSAAGTR